MKFQNLVKAFLPGIFLFGYTVGTGSVTAMAKAGADYGMSLLWTILLSCIITFILIHLYGKFALVTGETALYAFKKHIHPLVGIFFIITLTAHVCGSIIGVMGIVGEVCYEWSKSFVQSGIQPIYFAIFFILLVYLLFLQGQTRVFEKVLAFIVAIMAICFLVNFFILMPPPLEMLKGLIPQVPETQAGESSFLVIASMVGTTVFSGLFILRTTLVQEAGWTFKDLKKQRRDAMFSALMMFVVSASIMAAAAGTLHTNGIRLDNVTQMIGLMEPLAGFIAVSIFTIGLVAAGISSQFPNVTLLPWLLDDYHQNKPNMKRTKYRLIVFVLSLLGLIVPVFQAKPIAIMIISQAFGALILPVTVACITYLGNKKSLMGKHAFTWTTNLTLFLILIFAVIMSYMSYSGLWDTMKDL
ncbi:Nramp family divalent metal transporter [Catalinimonas niigatensis]|uniref:Nramp family divalent metal transporter n=1 Tax=Catalinimonas niigatensis TaxID=1397264 RepID=UPI0026668077|nr:Nramp family divalent metal transporter [Catalinimonas niigatensis]WPP50784.1 Nramp family divalent metal transporter [Catalinimonas niigatensis]